MNAQRVCSAVGSAPVGGWITAPVICVPDRVTSTLALVNGIGDSSHFSVYVIAVASMFTCTTSPLPAPPRYVVLTMSAVAGHNAVVPAFEVGGPCTPQLEPEHCGALIVPGLSA